MITIFSLHSPTKYEYEDEVLKRLRTIERSVGSNSNKLFEINRKLNVIDDDIDELKSKQSSIKDKVEDVLSYVGWIYDRLGGN